jgi:hypothetical protein
MGPGAAAGDGRGTDRAGPPAALALIRARGLILTAPIDKIEVHTSRAATFGDRGRYVLKFVAILMCQTFDCSPSLQL